MIIKQAVIDELEVLLQFPLDSTHAGIKIHNTAREGLIQAAHDLHNKGLISQKDGGYLTDLGYEAAEHLQHALRIMTS